MATTRSIDLTDEPVANDYVEVPAAAPTSTEEPVPEISDERREEINNEMTKLEDEINTLKQALARKERQLTDLRTELGITRWSRLQNSEAMKQSKQALSEASVKTGAALTAFGAATASKWTEIKQSERMQSVSDKFWSTTDIVKAKLVGAPKVVQNEPPTAQPAAVTSPVETGEFH